MVGQIKPITQEDFKNISDAISTPKFVDQSFKFYKYFWGDEVNATNWQEFWALNSKDLLNGISVPMVAAQEPINTMMLSV